MFEEEEGWDYQLELTQKIDDSAPGRLLDGAIDLHVHFEPESWMGRRFDALETALHAREAGMAGLVLKNRTYSCEPIAMLVRRLVPDFDIYGSIVLDGEIGGLNYHAVAAAAAIGTRVIWMPVFFSANSIGVVERNFNLDLGHEGISIIDGSGVLVPAMDGILDVIKDHDMLLCTGHISPRETHVLVEKCLQKGINKIVVTHPMSTLVYEEALNSSEMVSLAQAGAKIEYDAQLISPTADNLRPSELADHIRATGADNSVLTTDLGGMPHPTVAEGLRMLIATLLKCGISEQDIDTMVKKNPRYLLGLPHVG